MFSCATRSSITLCRGRVKLSVMMCDEGRVISLSHNVKQNWMIRTYTKKSSVILSNHFNVSLLIFFNFEKIMTHAVTSFLHSRASSRFKAVVGGTRENTFVGLCSQRGVFEKLKVTQRSLDQGRVERRARALWLAQVECPHTQAARTRTQCVSRFDSQRAHSFSNCPKFALSRTWHLLSCSFS